MKVYQASMCYTKRRSNTNRYYKAELIGYIFRGIFSAVTAFSLATFFCIFKHRAIIYYDSMSRIVVSLSPTQQSYVNFEQFD